MEMMGGIIHNVLHDVSRNYQLLKVIHCLVEIMSERDSKLNGP